MTKKRARSCWCLQFNTLPTIACQWNQEWVGKRVIFLCNYDCIASKIVMSNEILKTSSSSILSLLSCTFCSCPSSSHSSTRLSFRVRMGVMSGVIPPSSKRAEFQTHFKTSDRKHFLSGLDPLTNLLNIKQLPFIGAFGQPDELEGVKKKKKNQVKQMILSKICNLCHL